MSSPGRKQAEQAWQYAQQLATRHHIYQRLNTLFRLDAQEFFALGKTLAKWVCLGGAVGVLAGIASAVFLFSLAWATETRENYPFLLAFLPLAGWAVGWSYQKFGGPAGQGNNLVIEEVNLNRGRLPLRMAPMILAGTVITHLFGGSAGREGTALQMGSSLADGLGRWLGVGREERRYLLMAGLSGGFGSVFGTPMAGFVFGLEVQTIGRVRYEGVIPCLTAALVGDLVTRALGAPHSHYPQMATVPLNPLILLKVGAAGVAFGLTSLLFIELTHAVKALVRRYLPRPELYPVVGGLILILLTALVGTNSYSGLSLPLIQQALHNEPLPSYTFLLKLIFTAVTLGSGFLGGEVTPLFVIGSTLGYALSFGLGVDTPFLASIGFVAVFAGASNTPLACTLMALELFGSGSMVYVAVGCFMAYFVSGHRGIYVTQPIDSPKMQGVELERGSNLAQVAAARPGWMPRWVGLTGEVWLWPGRALAWRPPLSLTAGQTIAQLLHLSQQEGVRCWPVVDEQKRVLGIITDRDLVRVGLPPLSILRLYPPAVWTQLWPEQLQQPVTEVMTRPVVTAGEQNLVKELVAILQQNQLKRLPLVNSQQQLTGLVTRSDVLRHLVLTGGAAAELTRPVGEQSLEPGQWLHPAATVQEWLMALKESQARRFWVGDEANLMGVVTFGDVYQQLEPAQALLLLRAYRLNEQLTTELGQKTILEFATRPVQIISTSTPIAEALHLLLTQQMKRLPVVNENGEIIGFLGRTIQ